MFPFCSTGSVRGKGCLRRKGNAYRAASSLSQDSMASATPSGRKASESSTTPTNAAMRPSCSYTAGTSCACHVRSTKCAQMVRMSRTDVMAKYPRPRTRPHDKMRQKRHGWGASWQSNIYMPFSSTQAKVAVELSAQ
jgi:hypothetical protein